MREVSLQLMGSMDCTMRCCIYTLAQDAVCSGLGGPSFNKRTNEQNHSKITII
uniref:Uncharacterized protein n=1 Tax=Anguilla anguilla TaxID=7936 RepID=A0A0E9S1I8_ANGAN